MHLSNQKLGKIGFVKIYENTTAWHSKIGGLVFSLFFTQFLSDKDVQKFRGGTSSDVQKIAFFCDMVLEIKIFWQAA